MIGGKKLSGATVARVPRVVFGVIVFVTVVLFVITSVVTESHGGAHRAWEVLIGVRTPVGKAIGFEVALSVVGYAFVPVAIGLLVTDSVLRFQRNHTIPTGDALENIGEGVRKSTKPAKETQEPAKETAAQVEAAASPPQTAMPPRPPGQSSGA